MRFFADIAVLADDLVLTADGVAISGSGRCGTPASVRQRARLFSIATWE